MKPKFADNLAWQQAELLMQPVFIRLVDNLRKQLEVSSWRGTYEDVPIWADDVSQDVRNRVTFLRQQLPTASPEEAAAIEATLAQLPQPFPGYQLCLQQQGKQVTVDLWDLCYRICFRNFSAPFNLMEQQPVEIDTTLIDAETGDVDWHRLDEKTKHLVEQIFANLPTLDESAG